MEMIKKKERKRRAENKIKVMIMMMLTTATTIIIVVIIIVTLIIIKTKEISCLPPSLGKETKEKNAEVQLFEIMSMYSL